MLKEPDQVQSQFSPSLEGQGNDFAFQSLICIPILCICVSYLIFLWNGRNVPGLRKRVPIPTGRKDQLKKLKSAAELHIEFSELYLPMLQKMSQPCGSEKNTNPWSTLKEGSYYLKNAYHLVEVYKDCVSIDDENIQSVNDMLVTLEFDPKHITSGYTDEAYGGKTKCFVSKGQGTKYYELLHSEIKKDVRSFIEMVELNIDIPVQIFLESIRLDQLEKLKSAAETHICFSKLYLSMLRRMSQPYGSEKNTSPWKTLKKGSYYLRNAYHLVEAYKDCSIDNKNLQLVNDMLVTLEFDPKHITSGYTDETYGEEAECFVSKGQGTIYYKLLHSELKKDVRSFIEMVELNIDMPVKRYLESIKLDQLEKLERLAEIHLSCSESYLAVLRSMSRPYPDEKNTFPWLILKKGSYYLANAYDLVKAYKDYVPGPINNNNIQSINHILVALEFDIKHISSGYTDEAYGGEAICFVSRGQGTKYYKLLHSESCKDIRSFIKMVELNIDIPVRNFLESIKLDPLKKLKSAAKTHISFSNIHLPMLRSMSQPYGPIRNTNPLKTLKEGSYYLRNAYHLVEAYKNRVSGSINDKNIQSVNDMLVTLEFDPKHITLGYTDEAHSGEAECFVSKGRGTKYYKLLHSELKIDIRAFIKMVEFNIDIPVKRFLESLKQRSQ